MLTSVYNLGTKTYVERIVELVWFPTFSQAYLVHFTLTHTVHTAPEFWLVLLAGSLVHGAQWLLVHGAPVCCSAPVHQCANASAPHVAQHQHQWHTLGYMATIYTNSTCTHYTRLTNLAGIAGLNLHLLDYYFEKVFKTNGYIFFVAYIMCCQEFHFN